MTEQMVTCQSQQKPNRELKGFKQGCSSNYSSYIQSKQIIAEETKSEEPLTFESFRDVLPDTLFKGITESLKFTSPSEVQRLILEDLKQQQQSGQKRKNMIIQSKNGTGKTLAYTIIAAYNINKLPPLEIDDSEQIPIKVLIIAPTREIALQVSEFFAFLTKISPVLLIGGLDSKEQRRKLLVEKPLVVVGTPGRIREFIDKEFIYCLEQLSKQLSNVNGFLFRLQTPQQLMRLTNSVRLRSTEGPSLRFANFMKT